MASNPNWDDLYPNLFNQTVKSTRLAAPPSTRHAGEGRHPCLSLHAIVPAHLICINDNAAPAVA